MGTRYDDKSSFISYSGGWQTIDVPEAYQSSIHLSSSVGATATITFTGTAIRVYGTNPAHINNQPGEMQLEFILNGAVVERWSKGTHHVSYYQDRLWDSGNLQDRQHTFTVRNVGSQVPVHFDFFELWGTPVRIAPPRPPPSSTSQSVNRPPPSSTRVVVSTSVQIVSSIRSDTEPSTTSLPVSSSSSESSTPSSSSESVSSSGVLTSHGTFTTTDAQGREKTVTAFYTIPGTNSGQGGPDQDTPGNVSASKDSGLPRGAIAGLVVGIVLVLIAAALVLLSLRRRRRKALMLPEGEENNVAPFHTGVPVPSRRTLSRSLSDGRTFHRLDNTEDYSSTTASLSPHNPLQLSHLRAEKSGPLLTAGTAPTETPTSAVPSPIVSESEVRPFSTSGYSTSYDVPPPAYSPEHRQSSTYASAYTSFPPR